MLKFLRPVTRPWVAPETDADVNYRWTETEGDVSLT